MASSQRRNNRLDTKRLYHGIGSSLRAMDMPGTRLRKSAIFAARPAKSWFSQLSRDGFQGLYWADYGTYMRHYSKPDSKPSSSEGLWQSDWEEMVEKSKAIKTSISSPLDRLTEAVWYAMTEHLPSRCEQNAVMCTVAEAIRSCTQKTYKISTPHFLCPSEGGFANNYFVDAGNFPDYRCFLYLGSIVEPDPKALEEVPWSRHHAAIISHRKVSFMSIQYSDGKPHQTMHTK